MLCYGLSALHGILPWLTFELEQWETFTLEEWEAFPLSAPPVGYSYAAEYDAAGRRTTFTSDAGTTTYAYDAGDRLLNEYGPDGIITYTYDAAGNRIQKETPLETTDYTYDAIGRLVEVDGPEGLTTFTYDPLGRRILKETPTETIRSAYDFQRLHEERDDEDGLIRQYTSSLDPYGPALSEYNGDATRWFDYDALGSTRKQFDAEGEPVAELRYDPFGKPLQDQDAESPLRFVGGQNYRWDPDLELYLCGARYYDPHLGQFTAPDPTRKDQGEKTPYHYAGNNPANKVDPSGLEANEIIPGLPILLTPDEAAKLGFDRNTRPTIHIPVSFRDNPGILNLLEWHVDPSKDTSVGQYFPEFGFVQYTGPDEENPGNVRRYRVSLSDLQEEAGTSRPLTDRNRGDYWTRWFKTHHNEKLNDNAWLLESLFVSDRDPGFLDRLNQFQNTAELLAEVAYTYMSVTAELASVGNVYRMGSIVSRVATAGSTQAVRELHMAVARKRAQEILEAHKAGRTVDVYAMARGGVPRTITPRNAKLAGKTHPITGIPFDAHGYPDFSGVATHTVKIQQTGSYAGDFATANRAAGLPNTPKGFTWHHHQDGTTMQLVPTDIHSKTGHTGGMATGGY